MPDDATSSAAPTAGSGPDYTLKDLGLTFKDAAGTLAALLLHPETNFANVVLYPDAAPTANGKGGNGGKAGSGAQQAQGGGAAPVASAGQQGAAPGGGAATNGASQAPKIEIFEEPPALSGTPKFSLGETKIGLTAAAVYKAAVFRNGTADPDEAITVTSGHAWLKQELAVSASASASPPAIPLGAASLAISADGSGNVRLLDYRRHGLEEPVGEALTTAIEQPRLAFDIRDVRALDADACLAFLAGGKLDLSAKVSVSDTLSASLTALDEILGTSGALQFLQIGASVAAAVNLSDDFRVVLSRAASGNIAVAVNRAAGNLVQLTAGLAVTAQLAGNAAAALDAYLNDRLHLAYTVFHDLDQQVCGAKALADLPPALQSAAQSAADKLGLGNLTQTFATFKTKICGLEDKLTKAIQEALTAKVQAQFTFSWSRTKSDDTVLAFEIEPSALPSQLLHQILFGNLSPVLGMLAARAQGLVLVNYLDTLTVTTARSFGISLSLGKWSLGSNQESDDKWVREKNIAGEQRLSFDGRKGYSPTWLGTKPATYFIDLSAAMSGFASKPTLAAFQYGLHLSWTWQEPPSADLAAGWGDVATLWGVNMGSSQVAQKGGNNAEAAIDVVLTQAGVDELARAAADGKRWIDAWSWAMAAALPPVLGLRATIADRLRIYGGVSVWLLDQLRQNLMVEAGALAASYTSLERFRGLEDIDTLNFSNPVTGTGQNELASAARIWNIDSRTNNVWTICERIRTALAELSDPASPYTTIQSAFDPLDSAVDGDPFYMRVVGATVVRLLKQVNPPQPPGLFTATARFEWNKNVTLVTSGG